MRRKLEGLIELSLFVPSLAPVEATLKVFAGYPECQTLTAHDRS